MRILPFHEVSELLPLMAQAELDELAEDIRRHGQREPIYTYQGKIVDGRNRYRACGQIGVEPVLKEWDGKGSLIAFVVSENVKRRHLSPTQKAVLAMEVEPLFAQEAKQRQTASLKRGVASPVVEKVPQRDKGKARDKAAKRVGTNPHYVSDVKAIKQVAPDLVPLMRDDKLTIAEAKQAARLPPADVATIAKAMQDGASLEQAARKLDSNPILPSPAQARKQAIATGEHVLASNGYYIPPCAKEVVAMNETEAKLIVDFAEAVELIAEFTLPSPEAWKLLAKWSQHKFSAALPLAIQVLIALECERKGAV